MSKIKKYSSRKRFIFFIIAVLAIFDSLYSHLEAAENKCEGGEAVVLLQIQNGVELIFRGKYRDFLQGAEDSFPIPSDKERAFLTPLEAYFPNGFQACRYLGIKERSNIISEYIVQFYSPESSVYFYVVGLKDTESISGGILQFHISTDFVEIFELWK